MSNPHDNSAVASESEVGSASGTATAGGSAGSAGNVGLGSGTSTGRADTDRSFVAQGTDIDVGAAEAQKRGIAQDSHASASYIEDIRAVKLQAIQNAVETNNMVAKQALRHTDLAIDRQWNIDETNAFAAALGAAVAKALNDIGINKK